MSLLECEADYDFSLKICFLGDVSVGKTCIIKRFIDDTFSTVVSTVAVDFVSKIVKVDNSNVKITNLVYDTSGQERYAKIQKSYYRQSNLIIFVYDSTELESLLHIENWIKEVEKAIDLSTVFCVLLANKVDLPSAVINERDLNDIFSILASKCKCFKATCSARTGVSVVSVIEKAIREQIENSQKDEVQSIKEEHIVIDSKDSFQNVELNAEDDKKNKGFFRCFI